MRISEDSTLNEVDGFEVLLKNKRILSYDNSFQNSITFELSLTRHEYTRKVYSFLDYLGEIGGIFVTI